jgi:glycosyltransferase involved in cell wall biosynthesis
MKRLMIIVPCFNEQEVLPTTIERLSGIMNDLLSAEKISRDSGILLVNDGSTDSTWDIINDAHNRTNYVYGLNLYLNSGHQNALLAGLEYAKDICDFTITIDADLQDDIAVIEEMVDKFHQGNHIVYGVRKERKNDSFFKRTTANLFYKLMNFLGAKTIDNHADFRLMSSKAVEILLQYKERNMFLRGIVTKIGLKSDKVYYCRKDREAGVTKYPLKKMLSFAWEGITSLSTKPLKLIMLLGLLIIICSIIALAYVLISYLLNETNRGWASLMISIWFLGGVQLFSIGIVGQYVGKTYIETKERPRYTVTEILDYETKTN